MPTNQEYYGLESEWVQANAANIVGTNRTNQWLTAYFGPGYNIGSVVYNAGSLASGLHNGKIPKGQQLTDGYMIDDPIDNSLSYCGLGTESIYSHLAYLEYKTGMCSDSFTAEEDRSVTNFAFCQTQGSDTGFYIYNDSSTSGGSSINGSRSRWAPYGIDGEETSLTRANRNRHVTPYAQIPVRNTVFYPTLRVAANIQENPRSVTGMNIANVDWEDYMNLQNSVNYTTHPYILRITMQAYTTRYVDDIDEVTGVPENNRSPLSSSQLSGIAVLSPSAVADGEPIDIANPTQNLTDIYTYYNTRSKFATNAGGVMLFGYTSVGLNDTDYIYAPAPNSNVNASSQRLVFFPHPEAELREAANSSNTSASGWYYLEYYDDLVDWVMEQMACFGLFFTLDRATAQNGALNDDLMCLGILENGIGHGKWTSGEDNEDQPQWEWDTTNKSSYKPSDGGGGSDDPSYPDTNPILPSTPGFTLAGKGTQCYAITYLDMNEIMEDIFGTSSASYKELIEGLAMFGSNPMNAFISYKWYPFTFSSSSKSPIILGSTVVNEDHTYDILNGVDNTFKEFTASCSIQAENNFVNSRRSKAQLFLPFYGFYEVPMNLLMSQPISVSFRYNVPDAMGVWVISFGSKIYDFVECDPSIEVPLTGDNQREIMLAKRQAAANIGLKIGLGIATVAGGLVAGSIAKSAAYDTAMENILGSIRSTITGGMSDSAAISAIKSSVRGYNAAALGASVKAGITAAGGIGAAGVAISNTVANTARNVGNLSVNVPSHGAADATTFLNLPLYPFIIVYTPKTIEDYNEAQYKLKVGIACDKWVTAAEMPSDSLLKTGGIANMSTSGMEMAEIQELNDILQTGFYK